MNADTVKALAKVRGMSQSDLAREIGVSRQTVSHWFNAPLGSALNLYTKHLDSLAQALGVSIHDLGQPLPILSDRAERSRWETELLWDHIYPDLESFISGLFRSQKVALARLVQVFGLFQSEKIIGKVVWKKYPQYRNLLHPAYRKRTEIIWNIAQNP